MLLNRLSLSVVEAASRETEHYGMEDVLVDSEKGTVATDGHILARISPVKLGEESYPTTPGYTPAKGPVRFLLSVAVAREIARAIPKKLPILAYAVVAESSEPKEAKKPTHTIYVNDLETVRPFTFTSPEGVFPNWEAAIPKKDKATLSVSVNAELLMRLLKIAVGVADDHRHTVGLYLTDDASTILLEAKNTNGQTFTGLLVPLSKD